MRTDLFFFLALRFCSGVFAFLLFALVDRWFTIEQTKVLFFFLFLAGFFTSMLRALASIGAGLAGTERRSEKLRRIHKAFGQIVVVGSVTIPFVALTLGGPGVPIWALAAVCVTALFWGFDVDMLRATVGRRSIVAAAAAAGSLLAVMLLYFHRSVEGAFAAVLLQWLPQCLVNGHILWRLRRRIWHSLRARSGGELLALVGLALVAVFDGAIINAPFFLGSAVSAELGRSIGVVTRLFVASLILLPLVLYWSNGRAMSELAFRLRTAPVIVFVAALLLSGLVASSLFAAAYGHIARQSPTPAEIMSTVILLVGYTAYCAASRFRGARAGRQTVWLIPLAAACFAGIAVLASRSGAVAISTTQCLALVAASLVLAWRTPAADR